MFHDFGHALVLTSRHLAKHIENSLIGAVLLGTVEKIRLLRGETQALEKPAEMRWYVPFAWHDYLHMVDPRFLTLVRAGVSGRCVRTLSGYGERILLCEAQSSSIIWCLQKARIAFQKFQI